ncbi:HEPN domain-containing protein [Spirosoma pollinicola]|uniref:HEPN domain-containing protein n=1 Tax=Spirosoma pollinicola TaxID=2057025 RepID=UPI001F0BA3C7|nr:HEPN domain-containing protein [Spirosoma pollinicola]
MEEQIKRFLDHATDALDDVNFLHQGGRILALANRSYYAIFYCASALLLTEGITTKKHEGARVKFHELFVKTGRFTREAGQILERNFAARQSADYDMEADL